MKSKGVCVNVMGEKGVALPQAPPSPSSSSDQAIESSCLASGRRGDVGSLEWRGIRAEDRREIEALHVECFPVRYSASFYDKAVQNKHLTQPGRTLYSLLAVENSSSSSSSQPSQTPQTSINQSIQPSHRIAGAIISQFQDTRSYNDDLKILADGEAYAFLAYILTLATTEDYRRQGLASRLLHSCLSNARRNPRCGAVYLHVITYNEAAIKFYEKHNFVRVRELQDYYSIDNVNYNAYLYVFYVNGAQQYRDTVFDSIDNVICRVARWLGLL